MTENEIGTIIVESAIKVHQTLGPGLLESVYEAVLAKELEQRGLSAQRQVPVQINYDDLVFDEGFRADLIVEDKVIVEIKSTEKTAPVHHKQLQTYLKLTDKRLGYLLNFGQSLMKEGIFRAANNLPDESNQ